jgi:FRG domain-containing protein
VLISPSDHFVLHESVVVSAPELRKFIDQVLETAEETDCDVYWRGQADHRWGISSSLARLTDYPTALRDKDLASAESLLLEEARSWVTAAAVTPSNDLEWLALLQHHGVPTRLLDLTTDPLIATFFAVDGLDTIEGRLIAIAVPRDEGLQIDDPTDFEIGQLRLGELRVWEPTAQVSPRLVAQHGVFAVGRLPSTAPARHVNDSVVATGLRLMTRSEVVSVLSIPLYLVSTERGRNRRTSTYPSCFTARIHVDKSSLREQLAKRTGHGSLRPTGSAIDHASCYPDVDGLGTYSRILERLRRGIS